MFKKGFVPPAQLLDVIPPEKLSAFNKNFSNTPIRIGVISDVYEKDDEKNISKLFPEYDVITSEQNGELGQGFTEYNHCVSMDSMGGIADFFEIKRRAYDKEDFRNKYDPKEQDGSIVLILCADGFSDKAIIIGGLQHTKRESTLTKDAGHHMEGEFNGLNWQVNKDGEFTVTFKSKSDNDGKYDDEKAGGTHFKIDKKGSVDINTNGDNETYIKMDKEKEGIDLKAGAKIDLTAKEGITLKADANLKGTIKGDIEFKAEGKAKISSKSLIEIKGTSLAKIKGGNIILEAQNGVLVQSSQFIITAPAIALGPGGRPAVTLETKFIGYDHLGTPVVCEAQGPFNNQITM